MRQQAWWTALAVALVATPVAEAQVIRAAVCMTQVT
jgi:hypothetical protein